MLLLLASIVFLALVVLAYTSFLLFVILLSTLRQLSDWQRGCICKSTAVLCKPSIPDVLGHTVSRWLVHAIHSQFSQAMQVDRFDIHEMQPTC